MKKIKKITKQTPRQTHFINLTKKKYEKFN